MAKSKEGPFGKLSGKVGNLVFATWRGIPYVRTRPSVPVSNTPAQQTQRSRFQLTVKFAGSILPVIKAGFKLRAAELPERNAAISYLMKNAIRGTKPDVRIDYAAVLVAQGNLPPPGGAKAERTADENLAIRWQPDRELDKKRANDTVLALAYLPEIMQGVWSINESAIRADGELILEIPDSAAQHGMHVYLAFTNPDGTDASNSVYLGKV